ncbi:MAG: DUF5009 domain-containing protein [Akkermansia sp.]
MNKKSSLPLNSSPWTLAPERIQAIDALRGFDMFWLTGGLALFLTGAHLLFSPLPPWLIYHTNHVAWEGFAVWDMVMPLFIFIVGTAMPFSFAKRTHESGKGMIYFKILRRTLLLFLLGMIVQGNLLSFNFQHMRLFCNTLQAIAGGYLIASLCLLHLSIKGQIITMLTLLIGYWLCIEWIPFGNHPAGTLLPNANLPLFIDCYLEGSHQDGTDYAWILPQLAFGALTLLGVLGGHILKHLHTPSQKLGSLVFSGLICLILGYIWSLQLPIIKHLFTSSMVLWAAGWCFLLLAFFYLMTDILKLGWLAFPLKVLGSNAIFIYMWTTVLPPQSSISRVLFSGFAGLFNPYNGLVFQLCNYALIWSIMYYLYKKKTFLKV